MAKKSVGRGQGSAAGGGQAQGLRRNGGRQGQGAHGSGRSLQAGVLDGARNMAGNVGESTMKTARDWASGARNAAGDVAEYTQETVSQVAGKVRQNPWPALLIGAGATWLAVDAARTRYAGDTERAVRGASKSVGSAGQAVKETFGHVAEVSRGMASSVAERGRDVASTVAEKGRGMGEQVGQFVRENPFLTGAATLGVGLAVGMAIPASAKENDMLGEARDAVVRRARNAARGTVESVREVAESVQRLSPFGGHEGREGREGRGAPEGHGSRGGRERG